MCWTFYNSICRAASLWSGCSQGILKEHVKLWERYSQTPIQDIHYHDFHMLEQHFLSYIKKKCSLLQNVAAHDRNSYETRLEHSSAHDWCVWLVLELAACACRKQGAPQSSVLSPAQTPERGLGLGVGAKGRASESGKTIPKDLQTAKSNTATRKPWPASSENN